jgi:uncharacterized glyoxalase superfamily protein PhnB
MSGKQLEFFTVAPVLSVDDLGAAIDYYRDTLGFTVDFTWGDPPYYAVANRGEAVAIHLSEREDTSRPIAPVSVYVQVSNVDLLYEQYEKKGVEIFQPPSDTEYGMREFDVHDLNGHFLTFGQAVGG